MKKNFLAIASLLIAAMLLMVSCNQEVAPKNNLVEARLSVGYGRDLAVTGDTNTSNISLTYKMKPLWTNAQGTTENIHGKKESETLFTEDKPIGYVTPGLWEVEVFAYETAKKEGDTLATNAIFTGKANAYFSNQKSTVTVYLAPVSDQENTNTLNFEITMQDLVGDNSLTVNNGNGSFKLVYSVYGTTGSAAIKDKVELTEKVYSDSNNDKVNDTTTYKGSTTLASGFYRVNVSVISVDNTGKEDLVGGITKGFLLSGGKTATISGHIEPSDYEKVSIDAFYIDVKTIVTAGSVKYDNATSVEAADAKATVEFTATDDGTSGNTNSSRISYIWYVADTGKTNVVTTNENTYKVEFKAPGWKTVTCQTIYSVDVDDDTYSFADTQSTQVYVNPEDFEKAEAGKYGTSGN